jgi:hypothetical protein
VLFDELIQQRGLGPMTRVPRRVDKTSSARPWRAGSGVHGACPRKRQGLRRLRGEIADQACPQEFAVTIKKKF